MASSSSLSGPVRAPLVKKYGEQPVCDMEYFDGLLECVPAQYYYPKHYDTARESLEKKKTGKRNQLPPAITVLSVANAVWGGRKIIRKNAKRSKKSSARKQKEKGSKSIENLRELLHKKIESLKGGRKEDRNSGKVLKGKKKESASKKQNVVESKAMEEEDVEEGVNSPSDAEGDFMFSGIRQHKEKTKGKKRKRKLTEENQLKKLQKMDDKLSKMDKSERARILHEKKIESALSRAKGVAVKDDKKLLKKSIARKSAKKKKSQKAWSSRMGQVEEERKEKLEKRQENISQYIQKKKERKIAKLRAKRGKK